MIRHLVFVIALATVFVTVGTAEADWIFLPSYFSHDRSTGDRVAQYAPEETAFAAVDPTYLKSGYRHNQITLRSAGGSADRLHVVETWGEGESIRPYGEWQRPFREGATPYGPWGNPQGPWTSPFGAWVNPYGLGQIPQVFDFNYGVRGGGRGGGGDPYHDSRGRGSDRYDGHGPGAGAGGGHGAGGDPGD